jgi:hypothetical protein
MLLVLFLANIMIDRLFELVMDQVRSSTWYR